MLCCDRSAVLHYAAPARLGWLCRAMLCGAARGWQGAQHAPLQMFPCLTSNYLLLIVQPDPRRREPKLRREMAAAQQRAFAVVGMHALAYTAGSTLSTPGAGLLGNLAAAAFVASTAPAAWRLVPRTVS